MNSSIESKTELHSPKIFSIDLSPLFPNYSTTDFLKKSKKLINFRCYSSMFLILKKKINKNLIFSMKN